MNKSILLNCCLIIFIYSLTICQSQNVDQSVNYFLPQDFKNSNLTVDGIKDILKDKCKKASGKDNTTLYADIEKEAAVVMDCLSKLGNMTAIQEEMEIARPLGELDTVFQKYCNKVPEAESCLHTFSIKVQPCLTVKEREQNAVLLRVIKGLAKFACARSGGTIALFMAEEGPECLEANKKAISQCAISSFSEFVPNAMNKKASELFNLPEFVLSPEHCVDLEHFEKCTLHHLEQCREVTPSNIAESVFKYIKNETSCKSWLETRTGAQRTVLKVSSGTSTLQFPWILFTITAFYFALSNRSY